MTSGPYIDMRDLASPVRASGSCPVSGCSAYLEKAYSQWGELPYCPQHRIRIHATTRTFVYYDGPDRASKRDAALRNILFERDYFRAHILGNAAKAETHRICHETSEDALSWNVFSRLARGKLLRPLFPTLKLSSPSTDPELFMWGLRVNLNNSSAPILFPALRSARGVFEKNIKRFWTEPDIMLYVPGQWLVLIEAKFTQRNTIASSSSGHDVSGDKPKSREGLLRRYAADALPPGAVRTDGLNQTPFYSQLYRNLVFAIHMATELGVSWGLVNLVCGKQFRQQANFQDPTPFIHELLPEKSRGQFLFYSWESLYANDVVKNADLKDLAAYMCNKSANGVKAFDIE